MHSIHLSTAWAIIGLGFLPARAQTTPGEEAPPAELKSFLDSHLIKAMASYDEGKMAESANHIFKGVDSIHKNMISSETTPTKELLSASNTLEALAQKVELGKVRDSQTLEKNFAAASIALAKYYSAVAANAQKADRPAKAGLALNRAAYHIENAAKWSGNKLGESGRATVGSFRKMGTALSSAGKSATRIPAILFTDGQTLIQEIESGKPSTKIRRRGK